MLRDRYIVSLYREDILIALIYNVRLCYVNNGVGVMNFFNLYTDK